MYRGALCTGNTIGVKRFSLRMPAMRILLLLPTLVGSLSVGVQLPVSAVSRSRAGALRCCAGQTAAASLRFFWDQVVTATESQGVRESQLQPEKQHELLAEYLNSCAELCISDGCSVRVELLSPPTINLRVDASASSKGATTGKVSHPHFFPYRHTTPPFFPIYHTCFFSHF